MNAMRAILLCGLLVPAGCGGGGADAARLAADGARAHAEGKFADAFAAFAAAERAAGGAAPASLLHDLAVAALAAARPREAEIAAEKAAAREGGASPERDFLRGNAAFLRCARAEAAAALP